VLLALAALPAAASSVDLAVDPRFELLAVVAQLAGRRTADPAVEKRFGAFKEHPAVALASDLLSGAGREEAVTTTMIYLTEPPALALKDKDADIHFLNGPGHAEEMQRFLFELRRFARDTDFMTHFDAGRDARAGLEEAAKRSLAGVDPVAAIEKYLGVGLASRSHYVLLPPGATSHAFIVPYPLPPANLGAESFDAYTMSPDLGSGSFFPSVVWPEPLYVFIDPSFYYFEKLNIPEPAAFYGERVARCRAATPDCVKHLAVSAVIVHLERGLSVAAPVDAPSTPDGALIKALSDRLDEYDANRGRYPTLWHFYPRWFAVFEETAFPGRAPRKLALPAAPRIRSAADFFKPAVAEALLKAAAR